MKVAFYLNIVSPHQVPLAREVAQRLGKDNFIYIYSEPFHSERANMGWNDQVDGLRIEQLTESNRYLLEDADIVYTGLRCLDLIEKRSSLGKKTFYSSERWFKPPLGMLRMLVPSYCRMARRFVRLAKTDSNFRILPIGVHAKKDFLRMGVPEYKMTIWGYFVAPSSRTTNKKLITKTKSLRVLWVGRMIQWKRIDTIIRAVKSLAPNQYTLTLVGNGDKKNILVDLASNAKNVKFENSLPIDQIRNEMRQHDVYVLSSNGEEGWGAALSEAMEEGMNVLGTYEAGASATMLPNSHKFHAGDWRGLSNLLQKVYAGALLRIPIGDWTAAKAAERLLSL